VAFFVDAFREADNWFSSVVLSLTSFLQDVDSSNTDRSIVPKKRRTFIVLILCDEMISFSGKGTKEGSGFCSWFEFT
jgi:hypothetical protein